MSVIGIDFGTSYTYIYGYQKEGSRINLVELPDPDYSGVYESIEGKPSYRGIPSAIGQLSDGTWVVGKEVIDHWTEIRDNCALDMKSLLRNAIRVDIPLDNKDKFDNDEHYGKWINGCYYTCVELIKKFFKILLIEKKHSGFNYEKVDKIVIGVPASQEGTQGAEEDVGNNKYSIYNSTLKRDIFESLLVEEGSPFPKIKDGEKERTAITVSLNSEPVLAAYAYLPNNIKEGDTLFVLDLGGGTSDFTLVKKEKGKLNIISKSIGMNVPSGESIERQFLGRVFCNVDGFKAKYHNQRNFIDEVYNKYRLSLRKVKEQLFLSQEDDYIKIIATKLFNIRMGAVTSENIKEAYEKYCEYGRSAILTLDDREIRIAYNEKHKNRPCWEQTGDSGSELSVFVAESFENEKKAFYEKIREDLKSLAEAGQLNVNRLTVLFVGGTSNIVDLREAICENGLGLYNSNGTWVVESETFAKDKILKDNLEVKIVSPDDLATKQIAGGKFLTYANAVAYGAVQAALEENMRGDVPDVWIVFDKQHNQADEQLLSKSIKDNNNNVTDFAQNASAIYFKKEELLEVRNKEENPSEKLKLRFWILNKKNESEKNPSLSPFSITFVEGEDESPTFPEYYGVLFVADQINGETIIYAVKLKEKTNDSAQVFITYKFTDYNGNKYDVKMAGGKDSLDGKLANKRIFKKYIFGWSESTEDGESTEDAHDKTSKRKRSACSPVYEQVNGWELKNIKIKKKEYISYGNKVSAYKG